MNNSLARRLATYDVASSRTRESEAICVLAVYLSAAVDVCPSKITGETEIEGDWFVPPQCNSKESGVDPA